MAEAEVKGGAGRGSAFLSPSCKVWIWDSDSQGENFDHLCRLTILPIFQITFSAFVHETFNLREVCRELVMIKMSFLNFPWNRELSLLVEVSWTWLLSRFSHSRGSVLAHFRTWLAGLPLTVCPDLHIHTFPPLSTHPLWLSNPNSFEWKISQLSIYKSGFDPSLSQGSHIHHLLSKGRPRSFSTSRDRKGSCRSL